LAGHSFSFFILFILGAVLQFRKQKSAFVQLWSQFNKDLSEIHKFLYNLGTKPPYVLAWLSQTFNPILTMRSLLYYPVRVNLNLTCFVLFAILCIPFSSAGQKKYSLNAILSIKAINKTFVSKSKDDTTWRTYLGSIKDDKHRTIYYIIKEFNKIQAAVTWHGHSNVYFFNAYKKVVARVDVGLPENLPVQLENNTIYFPDDKNTGQVSGVKISRSLPKAICIRPDWCEEVIFYLHRPYK